MRRAEETKTSLLYEMLQTAVIRGIGNCTQVCSHVTDFLSTGVMPIAGWRSIFPGVGTNRNIDVDIAYQYGRNKDVLGDNAENDADKLLALLGNYLDEGQHVQVRGDMVGFFHETLRIGHVFNAIKIDGKVKIIDCYQGVSSEPWLRQAWDEPEVFLSYFKDFSISRAEESAVCRSMVEYLVRRISQSDLPAVIQAPLVSGVRTQFGFFNTSENSQHTENTEPVNEADPSSRPRSQ